MIDVYKRQVLDHRQVMGNEEVGELAFLLEFQQQVEHLGLYRMRRQHVVVVGKGQVLPGGQRSGGVGVGRDAFVFHLRIYDTRCLLYTSRCV